MIRLPRWTCIALALFLIAAVAEPASANVKIKKISPDAKQLVVTGKDGKDHTYQVGDDTKILLSTGKQGKLGDLKEGQSIALAHEKIGGKPTARVILDCQGAFKNGELAHGMVQSVAADKREFVLKEAKDKQATFTFADSGRITLNDKSSKLDDLKKGDHIVVAFEKKNGKNMAMCVCSWPK